VHVGVTLSRTSVTIVHTFSSISRVVARLYHTSARKCDTSAALQHLAKSGPKNGSQFPRTVALRPTKMFSTSHVIVADGAPLHLTFLTRLGCRHYWAEARCATMALPDDD